MQVNFNSYRATSPSFGMAKLTEKGKEVVTKTLGSIPTFESDVIYTKKNVLAKMLKKFKKTPVSADEIKDVFKAGMTDSSFQNKMFAKKQLLTMDGQRTIKSFLKKQSKAAGDAGNTEVGNALVNSVVSFFDRNISNEMISAKQGKAILDTVKKQAESSKISERLSIVTDKIFSK